MKPPKKTLLTGFPEHFTARRLLAELLGADSEELVCCLVPEGSLERARALAGQLADELRERVQILPGDIAAMDFGLSGRHYLELARQVHRIHHAAAATHPGVHRQVAERINVNGTGEVLEFAEVTGRLERLVLWSSALVSGTHQGHIPESEIASPPSFRNVTEETRFVAETMARDLMDRIPTTILRPSIVVGDSKTGEIDRFDGPYLLVVLMLNSPLDLRLPLPGRGANTLPLVPVDYVVEAGVRIVSDPRSVGRTYHLVDPRPLTARRVFEIVARVTGNDGPVGNLPTGIATRLLRTPGLNRVSHVPRAFLEQLATDVVYESRNAEEILQGTGIACPPFEQYAQVLVDYVRSRQAEQNAEAKQEVAQTPEAAS